MSYAAGRRLRRSLAAVGVVGAALLVIVVGARAETIKACGTKSFVEAVEKANGNKQANTIELCGSDESILPVSTVTFSDTSGLQTVEGPTTPPGAVLAGSAVEPFPSRFFVISAGVSVKFKNVEIKAGGGGSNASIEVLATKGSPGSVTIENSALAGNKGVGLLVEPEATATLLNSTVSDDTPGGGIVDDGSATLTNVTVAFNKGVGIENVGSLSLINTIVAENEGGNCTAKASSQDHSLDSDGTCGVEKSDVNPLLSELFYDGGIPTPLHSEKPGSPSIDAGDKEKCPATDQRGFTRPDVAGTACDIGADEYNEIVPTLEVPANISTGATSAAGRVVTFTPKATAPGGAIRSLTCSPESGSTFKIGTTTDTCTAIDGHENKTTKSFTVTVRAWNWFINGKLGETKHEPYISFGEITLKNATLNEIKCKVFFAATLWDEGGIGLNQTLGFNTWECKAAFPCEVTNERAEKKEGTFLSAEGPPTFVTEKARRSGNTSLPWHGELIERETGRRQILSHHVKLWVVVPLAKSQGGPGEGAGCEKFGGDEVPFEDLEGEPEKEAGDELAPRAVNGLKNGLQPSHAIYSGEKTEKSGAPETGRLISPTLGPGYLTGEAIVSGSTDFELLTLE